MSIDWNALAKTIAVFIAMTITVYIAFNHPETFFNIIGIGVLGLAFAFFYSMFTEFNHKKRIRKQLEEGRKQWNKY